MEQGSAPGITPMVNTPISVQWMDRTYCIRCPRFFIREQIANPFGHDRVE